MSECQHHDYTMVEDYIRGLQWSPETTDLEKGIAIGNIRGFYEHMRAYGQQCAATRPADASGLEACVQHGNSWLAVQTAGKRVVVTVPIEIASAVKRAATRQSEVDPSMEPFCVDDMRATAGKGDRSNE